MIYLEHTLTATDGKVYHQIRIHTACCKRVFLVEEVSPGQYFDIENVELCPPGMAKSIQQQIELATSNAQQKRN